MALISIPTSIGGVSIPGNIINGPLGALFGNKFGLNNYQYPRDLGSATKGHVVQFSINEIDPITYEEAKKFVTTATSLEDVKKKFSSITSFFSKDEQKTLNFKPKRKRKIATISMYIPDTLNFQYNAGYGNLSLQQVANEVAGTAGSAFSNVPILGTLAKTASLGLTVAQSNAAKLALSTQGLAINPQQQLLFDGIDFRTYQMAFTFTPYSRQEAETVKEIIKLFRYHTAPQITTGGAGMFFVPPSTFDLDFMFNGQRNNNVTRVAESVIESIDVNYAPNGWAAHDNGAPVQTTLTMNFREIELIDKDKIKAGY
jgi:hypothetical protein